MSTTDYTLFHGTVQTISWFALTHFGLWALYFKHTKVGSLIHGMTMGMLGLWSIIASLSIIFSFGFQSVTAEGKAVHNLLGFILIILASMTGTQGVICKFLQGNSTTEPSTVWRINLLHTIFGWVVIIFSRIPLYSGWQFSGLGIAILVVDVISFSLFGFFKFFGKRIQQRRVYEGEDDVRMIKTEEELQIYSGNYFIFDNKVYNSSEVQTSHPGGFKVIQKIRGKEVERYLFGMESPLAHTNRAINLAGPPIAQLQESNIFEGINKYNMPVRVRKEKVGSNLNGSANQRIYEVRLVINGLKYKGYNSIQELGKCYMIFSNSIGRLYTTVNFLQSKNVDLITGIRGQPFEGNFTKNSQSYIPLLIKKYTEGVFTSKFFSNQTVYGEEISNDDIMITSPRGFGLGLTNNTEKGEIAIFSGGTGLYPFCDLIDLLYKQMLVDQGHAKKNMMIENDPILGNKPFEKFTFSFYIAVETIQDIHPITLFELSQLSQKNKISCHLKNNKINQSSGIESQKTILQSVDPNFKEVDGKFNEIVSQFAKKPNLAKILICGPPRFAYALKGTVHSEKLNPKLFKII